MRPIEQISDLEEAKQVASLLSFENERLHEIVARMSRELEEAKGGTAQEHLELELTRLQELVERDRRKQFGDSTERRALEQGADGPMPSDQRGHGPTPQPELPLAIVEHELPEDERRCSQCDGELTEMGDQAEEYEEVTLVRRQFLVERHRRLKYRCRCNAAVATAPGPPRLVPGGRYSTEFAVEVACDKYVDHLPLERQRKRMASEGLVVTTQALWDQLDALAAHLQPVGEALRERILSSPVLHADETWWRVMGRRSKRRWWAWTMATQDAVTYLIEPSRSAEAASKLLGDYSGTVVADGYAAYGSLARAGPGFRLAHCWAHVRRKFVEAAPFYPAACGEALDLIGQLYAAEKRTRFGLIEDDTTLELRRAVRDEMSRAVVEKLRDWGYAQRATPGSLLRKAVEYMLSLWSGLTVFLDDPRVPLDNNQAERGMRGPALGRKNHYGSRSLRGTQVAALLYGLIETAKLCELDPRDYLLAATRAVLLEDRALLPHDLLS